MIWNRFQNSKHCTSLHQLHGTHTTLLHVTVHCNQITPLNLTALYPLHCTPTIPLHFTASYLVHCTTINPLHFAALQPNYRNEFHCNAPPLPLGAPYYSTALHYTGVHYTALLYSTAWFSLHFSATTQIGRASCRERVCQYV